ncbi:MAG: M28 family metallopeptidase [Acidimicrobiia bacterium]|nr:M28 family metallopeptidase [Acidimicrobiia bacterium]
MAKQPARRAKGERVGVVVGADHHFGSVRDVDGDPVGFDLTPSAARALVRLQDAGIPVLVLAQGVEQPYVIADGEVPVAAWQHDLGAALEEAMKVLGRENGIFVSADRVQRATAKAAGWGAVSHVEAAAALAAGRTIRFAGLVGRDVDPRRLGWMIPYEYSKTESGWSALALVDEATVEAAAEHHVQVTFLDFDSSTEDLLRVQFGGSEASDLAGHKVVKLEDSVAWIALGPDDDVEAVQIHGRHGHFVLLSPRPELLDDPIEADTRAAIAARHVPAEYLVIPKVRKLDLKWWLRHYCWPSPTTLQSDVDRYTGAAPLDASGAIVSRHVRHPDNARVVDALVSDLRDIGYCAYKHAFTYAGSTAYNVIADLPGKGKFAIDPKIIDRIRELSIRNPWPDPVWRTGVARLLGKEVADDLAEEGGSAVPAIDLELAVGLRPWWPWWLARCPWPGYGAGIVLVGCHLDSTAGSSAGYNPSVSPAPGADDDASGMAAVLAVARYLWQFRGELTHTVRFGFFNAEEVGLVGSGAYASKLKCDGAPLRAVVCADMIGYNSDANRIFEIHAGHTDPAVRDASLPIASLVRSKAAAQGRLGDGQIYSGTSWPPAGGSDRSLYDGAINRSDHASFQAQGYGAVVVSEDFFTNLPAEPGADPNPNYHRSTDTAIDAPYAADIACAIGMAAKELAT